MDNNLELEKMMKLLETINVSLKENEISISKIKEDISNVNNEELKLKKLYLDLCDVEQIKINIEMNRKNIEACNEEDNETIAIFEQKIKSLQDSLTNILDRLEENGLRDRKEYENRMNAVREKKSKISEMESQISEKEKETERLKKEKILVENKIKELEDSNKKLDSDKAFIIEENGVNRIDFVEKSDDLNYVDLKDKQEIHEVREEKNVTKRDLTKTKNVGKTSEVASFIGYEDETVEEKKEEVVVKPKKKKEETIDEVVGKMVRNLENIVRKFNEILQESTDNDLNKNVVYLKNKFEQKVYRYLSDAIHRFTNKRKEINNIKYELENSTEEKEEERLELVNKQLIDDIVKIETIQKDFTNDIVSEFDSFKSTVKEDSDYLYSLKNDIKNKINDIYSRIDDVDKRLEELKENSKENILEAINRVDKELDEVNKGKENIEEEIKSGILGLLDEVKQNIKESYGYEDLVSIMSELKQKISSKENDLSNKISEIEERRIALESGKRGLEEKYNLKKKNDDKEEILALNNQKQDLKEETRKIIEMANILKIKHEKFAEETDETKMKIKSNIKKRDIDISKQKNQILERVKDKKKLLTSKLVDDINKYNNEYTIEFERYIKKIQGEIDEIQKNINEYKELAKNIVVESEFEENFQLLDELKEVSERVIATNKYIECQNKEEDRIETNMQKEIQQNMSRIKPEDNINSKIDFGEIYEMEDSIKDVDEVKQSVYKLCLKLGMEEEINNNEIKLNEQHQKQDYRESTNQDYEELEEKSKDEQEKDFTQYQDKRVDYDGYEKDEQENVETENQEQIEEQTKEQIEKQIEEQTEEQTEKQIEEQTEEQTEKRNNIKDKPGDKSFEPYKRKSINMSGLDEYSDKTREVLMNIPWEQLVELKNMNKEYQKILYMEDLEELKNNKVQNIANLKEQYKTSVLYAKKLYEIKKYVLAYKKGMEELAKGLKSEDKEGKKEHANFMKMASKSLKIMKENGVNGFEDFRDKVIKNSDTVKQILNKTKAENEELVRLMGLIQAIKRSEDSLKLGI